jgi:hypothetical protein
LHPGWTAIACQDFEGSFPGAWVVGDNDGTANGEYYWAKSNCRAFAGSYSGWAVGGGANGSKLACGANYPNNAMSGMIYGPFSLADASAADLSFQLWLNTNVQAGDGLCSFASIDYPPSPGNDTHWYAGGNYGCITGTTGGGWIPQTLDLSNIITLGNLLGQSHVSISIWFLTVNSTTYPEGAYVDNVVVKKLTSGSAGQAASAANPTSREAAN